MTDRPRKESSFYARRIDERFCGVQPGTDGPVLDRLRSFGPIVGLVVGHFGEWNDGLERLVSLSCDDAAPRMRALLDARSERDSRGRCAWLFRREGAWAAPTFRLEIAFSRGSDRWGRVVRVGWRLERVGQNSRSNLAPERH